MPLTPEEFNKLALKTDLDRLENKVDKLTEGMSKMLTSMDEITRNYNNHETEHVSNIAAHDRFEVRITKLEESVSK